MKNKNNSYSDTLFDLSGKVALVSGGAGLLGREFGLVLATAGAHVVIGDIDENLLNETIEYINEKVDNPSISSTYLDVTKKDHISTVVDKIAKDFGSIDILVNSAAIDAKFDKDSDTTQYSDFVNFSLDMWNKSLLVNMTGMFLLTQQVCRIMEKQGKGSIINLGSTYGLVGPDQSLYRQEGEEEQQNFKPVDYTVCKAGVIGFTKYLAAYYSNTDIRVNTLVPGGVYNKHDDVFHDKYSKKTILGRMADKKELWGGLLYLASDASSYMTGTKLVIDGGWTAL